MRQFELIACMISTCLLISALSALLVDFCLISAPPCFVGIQYLREYLHLPQEIVPATLKRPARTETARARPKGKPTTVQ